MAQPVSQTVRRGNSWKFSIIYWQPKKVARNNITGYTAKLQVFRSIDETGRPLYEGTVSNGALTVDATNGYIRVNVAPDITSKFKFTNAYYKLNIRKSDGSDDIDLVYGPLHVE